MSKRSRFTLMVKVTAPIISSLEIFKIFKSLKNKDTKRSSSMDQGMRSFRRFLLLAHD